MSNNRINKYYAITKTITSMLAPLAIIPRLIRSVYVALLAVLLGWSTTSSAVPIVYTLAVDGGNTSGSIGGNTFTQGIVALTFTGDTDDVIPYSVPNVSTTGTTTGYLLLKGKASIWIYDIANGNTFSADFLPAAGIYVSTDNTHNSVGFGSFGVPPSDPAFPGPVTYPEGYLGSSINSPWATYDLKSNLSNVQGWAISCSNFPVGCDPTGPALATTAGDLFLDHQGIALSYFTAQIQSIPFASFNAKGVAAGAKPHSSFALSGSLTLGTASTGFNPATDAFSLQFGPYSVSLPAGSFKTKAGGVLEFAGALSGVILDVRLIPAGTGTYRFTVAAARVDLTGLANPASVQLNLGDNVGTANVTVVISRGDH